MNWLYYLLEANLYLVLFYGFYRLFLQNETFYNLNRYFLLLSTLLSFALPVLQLGYLKQSVEHVGSNYLVTASEAPALPIASTRLLTTSAPLTDVNWLYIFYLIVAFGFALKLGFSVYKIISIWLKAKKHTAGDITLVEVYGESTAFSFFNLLFIHPELADQPAVIKHEMVHIKQRHSFDVVFFELVQVICWFNPILHFIKKDMKLLHEYIADELTTNADVKKHEYALFLIQNSFGLRAQPITNQIFNQSILKRRINMLNKKRTAGWARLRLLLVLPLAGAMLCTSTMAFTKDYDYVDLLPDKGESNTPIQENPKSGQLKKQDQARYFFPSLITGKDGKIKSVDKRYIVINGKKVDDLNTFYGVSNAAKIIKLNGPEAIKKYGSSAKYGAVEISGSNLRFIKTAADGPPPPKVDQIKFPPPIVKKDKKVKFFTRYGRDETTGRPVLREKRYILVNNKAVEDLKTFYGVYDAENVKYLSNSESISKYGENGKFGAVEITGKDIKYFAETVYPAPPAVEPPPPRKDQVKFPLPEPLRAKPNTPRKGAKTPPPPVEPPPLSAEAKTTIAPSTSKPPVTAKVAGMEKIEKYLEETIKNMSKEDERLVATQKVLTWYQLRIAEAKQ